LRFITFFKTIKATLFLPLMMFFAWKIRKTM